jgi:predicted component of type VI protein secretion system
MGSVYLKCRRMTTRLDKTLKRELTLEGRTFILAVSPEGLKLTLKGKRKGQELRWSDLVSGDAALAAALNASLGTFAADEAPVRSAPRQRLEPLQRADPRRRAEPPRKSAGSVPTTSKRARRARKR